MLQTTKSHSSLVFLSRFSGQRQQFPLVLLLHECHRVSWASTCFPAGNTIRLNGFENVGINAVAYDPASHVLTVSNAELV